MQQDLQVPDVTQFSTLQKERLAYVPPLPPVLSGGQVSADYGNATTAAADEGEIKKLFPKLYGQKFLNLSGGKRQKKKKSVLKIGVVLSGGQAAGGHNVIAGVYDYAKRLSPASIVYGFLNGPRGVFKNEYIQLDDERVDAYRNQGGFDMIGSGRDKIESEEQFQASLATCSALDLDGLVIIGGDDSNTNAAVLGEYFESRNAKTKVTGVPKTIDGDLRNEMVEMSFGFDTACRTYSECIGNLQSDVMSAKKYYHWIRLMGRSASHITLECALQTSPNIALIGEEIQVENKTLKDITNDICDVIEARHKLGKHYGIILVPEGLIEFVPEVGRLISEVNDVLAQHSGTDIHPANVRQYLSKENGEVFAFLPEDIQSQLLMERDPHGNVQVSKIETEKLLIHTCKQVLADRSFKGPFSCQSHFFGYEGRSGLPSVFDCNYCYSLGHTAGAIIDLGLNGYMANIQDLHLDVAEWKVGGAPLTMMMNVEKRKGKNKPVIKKALVELDSSVFSVFSNVRDHWALHDRYRNPGPIQYQGSWVADASYTLLYTKTSNFDSLHLGASIEQAENDIKDGRDPRHRNFSKLEHNRVQWRPPLPQLLKEPFKLCTNAHANSTSMNEVLQAAYPYSSQQTSVEFVAGNYTLPKSPLRVGIVFNGRQTPGGNNVVCGLHRFLKDQNEKSALLGFNGGTNAFYKGEYIEVNDDLVNLFLNRGSFDMLGRSVDQMNTEEQLAKAKKTCVDLNLDAVVVVGGTISNTHAATLAEYFLAHRVPTKVVSVPGTVDGDLKNPHVETTFGFDTACKVFSQLCGNIETDCNSAKKYWYFIRLMGRTPSHIALECGLQTHPNLLLLGEEAEKKQFTLGDVTKYLADSICERREAGKNYGVLLVPEGFIQHVPEMGLLIREMNDRFSEGIAPGEIADTLTSWSKALFLSLPLWMRTQLLKERESSGQIQLSQIESEKLFMELVSAELDKRKRAGTYAGGFSGICHFFGYQARSSLPSQFDCTLAYTLGYTAGALASLGQTAVMANVRHLMSPVSEWRVGGVALASMLEVVGKDLETGGLKVAIKSSKVNLSGKAFSFVEGRRPSWLRGDVYRNPGPIQFLGDAAGEVLITLNKELRYKEDQLKQVFEACEKVKTLCKTGESDRVLEVAVTSLEALTKVLAAVNQ